MSSKMFEYQNKRTFFPIKKYSNFLFNQLGSTAIGIQTSEGVVLAVERRITSPLIIPKSIEKIFEVDQHIG